MEESSDPSRNTQYFCAMCGLMSDQISHHKAHLKTQKHIFKKKCFEQCVKMTTFHFYNSNHNNIDAIKNFEDDTGQKYEKHNEESRNKFVEWRMNREQMLLSEFPKAVIPTPDECPNETNINNWLEKILITNETIVIKPDKKLIKAKKTGISAEVKQNILNKTIEDLVNIALKTSSPYDIAVIMYKLFNEKYSFKSFAGNVWINKLDTTISSDDVSSNLRKSISNEIKNVFENCKLTFPENSNDYNACINIINMLGRTAFKNNTMNEAKELFFNN